MRNVFLDQKYLFWADLVQNSDLFVLSETWCVGYFKYVVFNSDAHFFCFRPEIFILGKFGAKN